MLVIRDKVTKKVRVYRTEEDAAEATLPLDIADTEEEVNLPHMTIEDTLEVAKIKANGKPHHVIVTDTNVEVELIPQTPKLTIAGEIRKARAKNKKTSDAPVTLE